MARRHGAKRGRKSFKPRKAPKKFPARSKPKAQRRAAAAAAVAATAQELLAAAAEPSELPPKVMALLIDYLNAFQAGIKKGVACQQSRQALEQIEDVLEEHGKNLTQEQYQGLVDQGNATWQGMADLGC